MPNKFDLSAYGTKSSNLNWAITPYAARMKFRERGDQAPNNYHRLPFSYTVRAASSFTELTVSIILT